MIWKIIVLTLLLLPLPAYPQAARAQASAERFVQDFYAWYVPLALKGQGVPASDLALKKRRASFSPRLIKALRKDSAAQAKSADEIVGLDGDPFLDSQDPEDRYEVGDVIQKGRTFWANVHGIESGLKHEKPDIVAEVAFTGGHWYFVNFHSSDGSDLMTTLKALAASRRKPPQ